VPFLVAVPFVVIITGLVVVGLAAMQQSQSSGFVGWLERTLGRAAFIVLPGAQAIADLTRWITRKLGDHFAGIERLTVGWVAGLYQYVERVGAMTLLWPLELFKVTYWLIWHEIPRQIRALPTRVEHVVHQVTKQLPGITKTIIRLPKLAEAKAKALIGAAVATYIAPYLAMLRWLKSHFHALTAVLPHTLPIPFGKTIAGIRARLRRLEKASPYALGVAAVVYALGRLRLGFLRCGNFRKAGRQVCGMNTNLLDSLLLDTVALLSVVSVVEFAKELQTIEGEAVSIFGRLIREFPKT
jgi:hypothetical protein